MRDRPVIEAWYSFPTDLETVDVTEKGIGVTTSTSTQSVPPLRPTGYRCVAVTGFVCGGTGECVFTMLYGTATPSTTGTTTTDDYVARVGAAAPVDCYIPVRRPGGSEHLRVRCNRTAGYGGIRLRFEPCD